MGNDQTNNVPDKNHNLDPIVDFLRDIASNEDEWNKASESPVEYLRIHGHPTLPGTEVVLIEAAPYPIGRRLELSENPCRPGWVLASSKLKVWGCIKMVEVTITIAGPDGGRVEVQKYSRCIQEGWIEAETFHCVPRSYVFSSSSPVVVSG